MARLEDRLHEELERTARPADPSGLYEDLIRRKERRRLAKRARATALAIAVIVGSVLGIVGLSRVFEPTTETAPAGPAGNGRIAYVNEEYDGAAVVSTISVVEGDGTDPRPLVEVPGTVSGLEWSPDARALAFVGRPDGRSAAVFVYTLGDAEPRALIGLGPNASPFGGVTWSPDGSELAYVDTWNRTNALFVMDLSGGEPRRLTGEDLYVAGPDWSPDGLKIVFASEEPNAEPEFWDLHVLDVDTGSVRQLTTEPALDFDPQWSPDGSQIVFRSRRDGVGVQSMGGDAIDEIYVMNADGTDQTRLTFDGFIDQSPTWSPDGSLIAYGSQCCADDAAIVIMTRDGSNAVRLPLRATDLAWQTIADGAVDPVTTPTTEPPSPSESAEPSSSPSSGPVDDIGLGFPVCDLTSVRGEFEVGVQGTAFVATRMGDAGGCPANESASQIIAVDVDGDDRADVSYGPLACDPFCSAFAAPDVDGDGTDEILVQNIQFSIAGIRLYELTDDRRIVPVTVNAPEASEFDSTGFERGTEPQFWVGGDAGNADAIRCQPYDDGGVSGIGRVLVSVASHHEVDARDDIEVVETTFLLDGTVLTLVNVSTFTWPFDEPSRPFLETGGCGADLSPF